jgi:hypothetical protein
MRCAFAPSRHPWGSSARIRSHEAGAVGEDGSPSAMTFLYRHRDQEKIG